VELLALTELDYRLERCHPPDTLKGLPEALSLLVDALQHQQRILVIGDFDADGATSTAVALSGLRALGAQRKSIFLSPIALRTATALHPALLHWRVNANRI
jgi:single-stranded-DNA-specific exonuclease